MKKEKKRERSSFVQWQNAKLILVKNGFSQNEILLLGIAFSFPKLFSLDIFFFCDLPLNM